MKYRVRKLGSSVYTVEYRWILIWWRVKTNSGMTAEFSSLSIAKDQIQKIKEFSKSSDKSSVVYEE